MNRDLDSEIGANPGDLPSSGHEADGRGESGRPAAPPRISAGASGARPADAQPAILAAAADPAPSSPEGPGAPLSRQELAAVSNELAAFFPQPFDETRVVLMVVDPYHVHAYWHIRLDDLDASRRQIGPDGAHAPIVLRFYDITFVDLSRQGAHRSFDVAVHGLQNNWYVQLWQDLKSYVADIGLCKPDGALVALARSNVIHTQRSEESPHYERAGIALEPDGTQRQVPDFVHSGLLPAPPAQPSPQMPRDRADGLVRQGYQRLMQAGRPGPQPAALPGLKGSKGEF